MTKTITHVPLPVLIPLALLVIVLAQPVPSVSAADGLHACDYQATYGDIPCSEVDRAISESAAEFAVDEAKMRQIVRCESKFNPYADAGPYEGLFQQAEQYWDKRVAERPSGSRCREQHPLALRQLQGVDPHDRHRRG